MSRPIEHPETARPLAGALRPRAVTLELSALAEPEAAALCDALLELARATDPRARLVMRERELPWSELSFIAVDVETTGFQPKSDRVIEVAWVRFEGGREVERFSTLLNPGSTAVPQQVRRITGIDNGMLVDKPAFASVAKSLCDAVASADFIVAYNASFDRSFLVAELGRMRLALPDAVPWVDPLAFVRDLDQTVRHLERRSAPEHRGEGWREGHEGHEGHRLADVARRFGVHIPKAHRAEGDARATGELLLKLAPLLKAQTLAELVHKQARWVRLPPSPPPPPPAAQGIAGRLLALFR